MNYSKIDTTKIEEKNIIKNKFAPNLSATFLNTYPIYDNLLIDSYLENEDIIKQTFNNKLKNVKLLLCIIFRNF